MMAYAANLGRGDIVYPGLIAAWSAKGKSNDDEDRAILKDLTGNGHDITLNGFAFTSESGYNNPLYPDALVFDGVNDYGINKDMPIQDDFTLIVNREYINTNRSSCLISKANVVGQGAFIMEIADSSLINNAAIYSFGALNACRLYNNNISYLTPNSYNNINISRGTANDTSVITLGTIRVNDGRKFNGAFYSAYLFDHSLDEQEIKAFIRKYIDSEYLLPSEQYLVLNQGKLNINKLK